ncbi:MAG: corrinoid protein [Desulfobacterales bacterium]|nr:corrinoid protein [Desulfobacterales bacterium]
MPRMGQITEALVSGDHKKLTQNIQNALSEGRSAPKILSKGLIPGMTIVGGRMESGEMFIPEVLMTAMAMKEAVSTLKPALIGEIPSPLGRVVLGTVKGDLHDIGKTLVGIMLEGLGFEIIDLGVNVEASTFIETIKTKKPHIVGISALLTTTLPMMKRTIEEIRRSGVCEGVKIMIGGAPVDQAFALRVGADLFAADAGSAGRLARSALERVIQKDINPGRVEEVSVHPLMW